MSQRCKIDHVITDEYGDYVKNVKVIYYFDKIICPSCNGAKFLIRDNREDLNFSDSYLTPLSEVESASAMDACSLCKAEGKVEKIDYKAMTPLQIEIYEAYRRDMELMKV